MKPILKIVTKSKCPYCAQGELSRLAGAVRCSHCSKVIDYVETIDETPTLIKGLGVVDQNEPEVEPA